MLVYSLSVHFKMIRVDFIRHGECLDNAFLRGHSPSELSALGEHQMHTVFSTLPKPDWVISSPAQRCLKPAKNYYSDLTVWSSFQERCFGIWDGLSYEEVKKLDSSGLKRYLEQPFTFDISKSESLSYFENRVVSAFKKALEHATIHSLNHVCIVTHGGVMRVLLKSILGLNNQALFQFEIGFGATMTLECFTINCPLLSQPPRIEQEKEKQNIASLSDYFIKLVALTPSC